MNNDIIKGKWNELKGKLKEHWGSLTDDDLTAIDGSYDRLKGTLQKKYGYSRDKFETEMKNFIDKHHNSY